LKIVITAAGMSKRFYDQGYELPKFMLPVIDCSILESIILMFQPSDLFLVVTTHNIKDKNYTFFKSLMKKYRNLSVLAISEHKCGPVETINQEEVLNWIGKDPFIVSYCDFLVIWDYKSFLTHIESSDIDGCIVSFRGMQPASRGDTLFAYLRNSNLDVLEVREKESFTENRKEEYASVGIYYFKSVEVFLYSLSISHKYFKDFSEQYISLVYSGLIELGLHVSHYPVNQFLCFGTPKDYEEFLYWKSYFQSIETQDNVVASIENKLIPMAGFGERFNKAGFKVPKPFIPIRGKAMFLHALESFPRARNTLLVLMKNQSERVLRATSSSPFKVSISTLEHRTTGPGVTILESISSIPAEEEVVVMSCDYEQICEPDLFDEARNNQNNSVIVFYTHFNRFRMNNPRAFAYCQTDEFGVVKTIVEKQLISMTPETDKLLVGSFWFRHAKHLELALKNAMSRNVLINGELYVANSLNELLKIGIQIRAVPVKHWISFGDPEEFEIYNWWEQVINYLNSL